MSSIVLILHNIHNRNHLFLSHVTNCRMLSIYLYILTTYLSIYNMKQAICLNQKPFCVSYPAAVSDFNSGSRVKTGGVKMTP